MRGASAGARSVTDQQLTSSTEDLKQEMEDKQSLKSCSPSEKDREQTQTNNENESPVPEEDNDVEKDDESNIPKSSDQHDEGNIGNYSISI